MRLRNIPGCRETISKSKYMIQEEERSGKWSVYGKWDEVFGNDAPIYIEIGMGKGTFLMQQARLNPNINFVGIEKFSSVILRAVQKQDEEELANVRFLRMEAEYLTDVFSKNEVDRIYLNFSDPWPKEKHAKRRLTSRQFLERYESFLRKDGICEFKTDNTALFDFSLEECVSSGWRLISHTYDLYNSDMIEGNVQTEYEKKFVSLGQPICKLVMMRP